MDPNKTLELIRYEIGYILESNNMDVQLLIESGQTLADLVLELDEWIKRGGFLPNDWKPSVICRKTHIQNCHACDDLECSDNVNRVKNG